MSCRKKSVLSPFLSFQMLAMRVVVSKDHLTGLGVERMQMTLSLVHKESVRCWSQQALVCQGRARMHSPINMCLHSMNAQCIQKSKSEADTWVTAFSAGAEMRLVSKPQSSIASISFSTLTSFCTNVTCNKHCKL